jgi:hypothetical protein
MRYVHVALSGDAIPANILDPEPYLRELPKLQEQLPAGARAFATDSDHYDFGSSRCVKDLRVENVAIREVGHAKLRVELSLAPNRFKHLSGLFIRYEGVTAIRIDASGVNVNGRVWPETPRLGDIQLDEILPSAGGCSHEIKLTGGSIEIVCEDLRAEWI